MSDQDKTVLALIEKVKQKRKEITNIDNPSWQTNCSVPMEGRNVNIRTIQSVDGLVEVASYIKLNHMAYAEAAKELGVESTCKLGGYTTEAWMNDIKLRVSKLSVDKKKKDLAKLEARLDKVISPELKTKMELEAIEAELGD